MKPRFLSVFLGLLFPVFLMAQVNEQFSSSELSSKWVGNVDHFAVTKDFRLQLNGDPAVGESYLATECSVAQSGEWSFSVMLDFNPSGSNYARFYLISDSPIFDQPLNGYYVQVGNAKDQILLYRQSGKTSKLIAKSAENRLSLDAVSLSVKVTRSDSGEWRLSSKLGGEANFTEEFSVVDSLWNTSYYIGLYCKYTKTYVSKFYFDEIRVKGETVEDHTAPEVSSFVQTDSSLVVSFSERMNVDKVSISLNEPLEYDLVWNNQHSQLSLFLKDTLNRGVKYLLSLSDLSDVAGNTMEDVSFAFALADSVAFNDLVFTEIMFYPEAGGNEFVEIYNRSDKVIDLSLLKFSTRKTADSSIYASKAINAVSPLIFPGEYRLLTENREGVCDFYDCPDEEVFAYLKLPALNNTAGCVVLFRAKDTMIVDNVYYEKTMHSELVPNGGRGVSLERVSPDLGEWVSASASAKYATPGRENSSHSTGIEDVQLRANRVCYPYYGDDQHFRLRYQFDHPGYVANVVVYSMMGIPVATVASDLSLATEGELVWNGCDDNGRVLPVGSYVVRFEAFSVDGKIVRESFVVVVSH